jgi:hypothetical protein
MIQGDEQMENMMNLKVPKRFSLSKKGNHKADILLQKMKEMRNRISPFTFLRIF